MSALSAPPPATGRLPLLCALGQLANGKDPLVKLAVFLLLAVLALLALLWGMSSHVPHSEPWAPLMNCLQEARDLSLWLSFPQCATSFNDYIFHATQAVREGRLQGQLIHLHERMFWIDNLLVDAYATFFIVVAVWGYQHFTGLGTLSLRPWRVLLSTSVVIAMLAALADHAENFWVLARLDRGGQGITMPLQPRFDTSKDGDNCPRLAHHAAGLPAQPQARDVPRRPPAELYTSCALSTVSGLSVWKWRFIALSTMGSVAWICLALAGEWRWWRRALRFRSEDRHARLRFQLPVSPATATFVAWKKFHSLGRMPREGFPFFPSRDRRLCLAGLYFLLVYPHHTRSTQAPRLFSGAAALRYVTDYFDVPPAHMAQIQAGVEEYLRWLARRGQLVRVGLRWEVLK